MKATLFVLISLFLAPLAHSDPVDNWIEIPKPVATTLISIAHGTVSTALGTIGIFVAVGENGTILTSTDGASWTAQNSGVAASLGRVKFVNDRFFAFEMAADGGAVGFGTETVSSLDGISWTKTKNFADVTAANGSYFGVDVLEGSIWRSTDSQNWTRTTSTNLGQVTLEVFDGTLVATPIRLGPMSVSSDGVRWSPGSLPDQVGIGFRSFPMFLSGASVQNDLFFVNGTTVEYFPPVAGPGTAMFLPVPAVLYSNDLLHWQVSVPGQSLTSSRVIAGGTSYVMVDQATVFHTDNLSTNWATFYPEGIYESTNLNIISGNWTQANLSITNGLFKYRSDLAFGSPYFVAIADGRIFRSEPVGGAFAPQIYKQPASFAATIGATATLTVGAQGTPPITYQWRKNGTTIEGATNSVLTLNNFSFTDAGEYDVIVSNQGGTTQSDKAAIAVNFAEVHTYSGITLLGSPGDKFLIESRETLDSSAPWQSVTNITLADTKFLWLDLQSPDRPKRYFRATHQAP